MEFADVANKLLLLLEKTKDSLIKDLENQFAGVRKAVEDCSKTSLSSATPFKDIGNGLTAGYKVVDAVFAQVGFDISHCKKTSDLGTLVTNSLALMDKLKDTIAPIVNANSVKDIDYTAVGEAAMGCFKDIKELIEGYSNVKANDIIAELSTTCDNFADGFDIKDFVKKIVEHILITLLRNGQEVFADEIRYIRMQANNLYSNVQDIKGKITETLQSVDSTIKAAGNDAKVFAETLFNDSVREMEDVYSRLSQEARAKLDQARKELAEDGRSIYEQIADGLAKAYAILDFLGVLGEKEVTLKLPKAFISGLESARSTVAGALSDALSVVESTASGISGEIKSGLDEAKTLTQDTAKKISGDLGDKLKLTGELVDVSAFGITAIQQQMAFISSNLSNADAAVQAAGKMVNGKAQELINAAANFSYSLTITTFRWGRIERMFTSPVSYFKALYPVDTLEDAQNLIDKVLGIARLFNPDVPDFRSIRNLLESLLKSLADKMMSLVGKAQSEFWNAVKPLMVTIRKVLDLLKELYEHLVKEATEILKSIQDKLFEGLDEGKSYINDVAKELKALADEISKSVSVPSSVEKLFNDIVKPAVADAVRDSTAPNPEALAADLKSKAETEIKAWASGVYSNLYGFFSPDLWKERLNTVLGQLQSVFEGDVNAVQGLLSGAMQTSISGGWGKKFDEAFKELDITQYIDVLSSALDDVSLPRPSLYFDGFVQCMDKIFEDAKGKLNQYGIDDVKALAKDVASNVWNRIVNQIFMPIIRKVKAYLLRLVREAIREVLCRLLDVVRNVQNPLEDITDKLPSPATIKEKLSPTLAEMVSIKEQARRGDKEAAVQAGFSLVKDTVSVQVPIDKMWIDWVFKIVERTITFCTSDMGYDKIFSLVTGLYSDIPEDVKGYVADFMPTIPENEFTDFIKQCDYKADLENVFVSVTLVKLDSKDEKAKKTPKSEKAKVDFNATALLQLCFFAIDEPVGGADKKDDGQKTDAQQSGTQKSGGKKTGSEQSEGQSAEEEQETETVLYAVVVLNASTKLAFPIGKNHEMSLSVQGGVGNAPGATVDEKALQALSQGCGLKVKKDWNIEFIGSTEALNAMFNMTFHRTDTEGWQVFDTKYLSMKIGNYPQVFYLGFGKDHPDLKEYNIDPHAGDKNKFQLGYFGAIQGATIALKLQDVAFIKEVIKDDVELNFDTYLWYDLQKGFDFGGDVSLHLDYDLNHKKLGPLVIDSFSLDAGSVPGESGKLQLAVASTFQVDFGGVLVVAIENLGIGFLINYKDKDGNYGDFDIDASLQYPSGFGLSVDASAVKGAGIIQIDQKTGEFFGALELVIIKKIGVGAFVLCDPGTAKGHDFSMVVLLSARFSPGIPLGMGFSLTAIGGTLGLNRQISRDAIQNGVRTGTLDQVFFVENIKEHLAEMKTNVIAYFPEKKGQFFFGVLGQISYEPVVKCDFGLLLQVPKPTEIIIVGALRVNAAEGIVKINVYFAGGINFEEGMWFDASIVDSQIVGISISGDMAFRLNWGGTKGFLLSIGGFHPAYKPEEGLHVGKMNRLAMKLDYSILKISFETYMAITSNSFQIGARFDLKVGWDKFGITGYAGFDALFQFDPFLFMFSVCAGVSVKCGSWNLLSIDLSMDVQGPAPWKIAGKAKFWFLFIPIKVDFSKTWGKDTPELPSKLVEVIPLFAEEWKNDNNWIIDNSNSAGQTLVSLFDAPEGVLIAQPDGSVTFNQSIVPMKTVETKENPYSLEKMDICNDAVPQDYNSIFIDKVNDKGVGTGNLVMEQNDFAPSLYKLMNVNEKLKSESYVKYDSGFTMNLRDSFGASENDNTLERTVTYFWQPLKGEEKSSTGSLKVSQFSAGDEKLTASVKQVKNLKATGTKVTPPVDTSSPVVRPASGTTPVVRPASATTVVRPATGTIKDPASIVRDPSNFPNPTNLDNPVIIHPVEPIQTVNPGRPHGFVAWKPKAVPNNRRDRAAFDRYLAVLQKKAEKTNKQ